MYGEYLFVSEGQLYSEGLLGTAGPGSPDRAASTAAEISPRVTDSAAETVAS